MIIEEREMDALDIALDQHVTFTLPKNARIIRASDHVIGHYARTIRLDTRAPHPESCNGLYKSYILKLVPGKTGHDMMRGEYGSMKALYDVVPHFVPEPIAWGTLIQDQNLHFFLCDFHRLDSQFLNIDRFAFILAELHQKSTSMMTSDRYGFHGTTHIAHLPQRNGWTYSWEENFRTNFSHFLDLEKDVQGPHSRELRRLSNAILSKVIPRLLRPLESHIRPTLLHGDIIPVNASTSLRTGQPIVYSACALYGHNEYDIRNFIIPGNSGRELLDAYHKLVPVSEPREDLKDRLTLYGLRSLLHESCLHKGNTWFREKLIKEMRKLVWKFPNGHPDLLDVKTWGAKLQVS